MLTVTSNNDVPTSRVQPMIDWTSAHERMFSKAAQRSFHHGRQIDELTPAEVRYLAFNGLRWIARGGGEGAQAHTMLQLIGVIDSMLACLTPRQFLQAFPVSKVYDGARINCVDYYSTMEAVRALPMDMPIGKSALQDFLWDYLNKDVMRYKVAALGFMDTVYTQSGRPTLLERFFAEGGLPLSVFAHTKDEAGRECIVNIDTSECLYVKRDRRFKPL